MTYFMKPTIRTKYIIAVFGSTNNADDATLTNAEKIGAEVANAGCILLTGGTGSKSNTVKDCAIGGAEGARNNEVSGWWIGVSPHAQTLTCDINDGLLCIINTNLSNKRNFLEGCLCDAAIAFDGGDGTVSEVISCLSMQKPVALIGEWEIDYPLNDPKTINKMVEKSFGRFNEKPTNDTSLDHLLVKDKIIKNLTSLPSYTYYSMKDATDTPHLIVKNLLEQLEGFSGEFPALPLYNKVKAQYDAWVNLL